MTYVFSVIHSYKCHSANLGWSIVQSPSNVSRSFRYAYTDFPFLKSQGSEKNAWEFSVKPFFTISCSLLIPLEMIDWLINVNNYFILYVHILQPGYIYKHEHVIGMLKVKRQGILLVIRSGGRGLGNLFTAVANHVATTPRSGGRGLGNLFTAVANHVVTSPSVRWQGTWKLVHGCGESCRHLAFGQVAGDLETCSRLWRIISPPRLRSGGRGLGNLFTAVANHVVTSPSARLGATWFATAVNKFPSPLPPDRTTNLLYCKV